VGWLQQDGQGSLFLPTSRVTTSTYKLHVLPPFGPDDDAAGEDAIVDRDAYTELPGDLDPEIGALAVRIGGMGDDRTRALRLRDHVRREYSYTRAPRDADVEDPLPVFLFERRSGHCEYFASALAVLLRADGIPSRVVNGFAGGDPNPLDGYVVFRKVHAHAWVEAWVGGAWIALDATPGPAWQPLPDGRIAEVREAAQRWWYDGVLRYDVTVQTDALLGAGRVVEEVVAGSAATAGDPYTGVVLVVAGSAVAIALLAWVIRRIGRRLAGERARPRPKGRVARLHHRTRRQLERRGWKIPASLPPVAAGRWLAERREEGAALERLAWLHYQVRYGGADDAALAGEARRCADEVARIAPPTRFEG
jgi:hypothetical protein